MRRSPPSRFAAVRSRSCPRCRRSKVPPKITTRRRESDPDVAHQKQQDDEGHDPIENIGGGATGVQGRLAALGTLDTASILRGIAWVPTGLAVVVVGQRLHALAKLRPPISLTPGRGRPRVLATASGLPRAGRRLCDGSHRDGFESVEAAADGCGPCPSTRRYDRFVRGSIHSRSPFIQRAGNLSREPSWFPGYPDAGANPTPTA